MPGAAARNTEPAGAPALFTAPVLQWLLRRECRGVHLLDGSAAGSDGEWITAPVGPHGGEVAGWCFGWRDDGGGSGRLLLAFARPDALSVPERAQLSGYLALAAPCAAVDGGDGVVLLDGDGVGRRIHALRNAVNSLLMNVAVLATRLPPDDRAGRFATQAQADGERCAAQLQSLADALRPPGR